MGLPGVKITLGSGGLGRVSSSSDGVAGLLLTGSAVEGKLELNKHYQLSSTKDLSTYGVTSENNPLLYREIKSFYGQVGEGAELHLLVAPSTMRLSSMVSMGADSPLSRLIEGAAGRIKIVGVNRLPESPEESDTTEGLDGDVIAACAAAQQSAESFASRIMPFRMLLPAIGWTGDNTFAPNTCSYNRVGLVLASEGELNGQYPAAIGMVLGRAAKAEPHQDLGRVKFGSLAPTGYFTNGTTSLEKYGMAGSLNEAGYIFFVHYPGKNGCYLNGCPMATGETDDYATLNNGRIMDKAMRLAYDTYISEIMDNIAVGEDGKLPNGVCRSFESMIENAVSVQMEGQISSFSAYVNPEQNILSSSRLEVECRLVPLGVLKEINVLLSFSNPSLAQ